MAKHNKLHSWLFNNSWKIIFLLIGIIIWGIRLEMTVNAMQDKGVKLREEYESTAVLMLEIRESQIRTEEFIKSIKEGTIKIEY